MKIHDAKTAPNPRRVRIFLAEKGVTARFEQVDIVHSANRLPEFLRKNPMGRVPVLELDDGTCIAETVAICRYFERMYPEPTLMGIGALDEALIEMWNRRMEFELFLPLTMAFQHSHEFFKGRYEQVPEFAEVSKRKATEALKWLDQVLAECKFIAGDSFSIADITALCGIDFGRVSNIRIQPEQKHLQRWHSEVSSRASAKA